MCVCEREKERPKSIVYSFSVFTRAFRLKAVSKCIPAIPAYINPRSENEKRLEEEEIGIVQVE